MAGVIALTTAGLLAPTAADAYVIPDRGSQSAEQTSATIATPAGTHATLGEVERLQTPGFGPVTATANVASAGVGDRTFSPGQYNATFQAYNTDNFPSWDALPFPVNNGQFYPWETATLAFEHPIADPVLTIGGFGSISTSGATILSAATFIAGVPTATTPAGTTFKPNLTLSAFTPDYTVDSSNMIQAPVDSYPVETGTRDGSPPANHSEYQRLLDAAIPNTALTAVPRGTGEVHVDTAGQPVSSVTIRIEASALNEAGDVNAGIVANLIPRVSVRMPTEVSGSTTPPSYGPTTHTATDLRLGTESVEAFADSSLTAATAGNAADNSDVGYDALDQSAIASFMSSFNALEVGKRIGLAVPISGVSKTAGVRAWLDFNGNGVFDAAEACDLATVGAGSTSATLTWTVPDSVQAGDTWLRLRTSYDADQLANASGWADSGEVEDYPATIAQGTPQVSITKVNNLPSGGTAGVGQEVTYTMVVTNQSSTQIVPMPTVTDSLPSNVAFVSATGGGVDRGDGTVVWDLDDIPAGGSVTVTVTVEVIGATASTTNTVEVDTPRGCQTIGSDVDCRATNTFPAPQAALDVVKNGSTQATIQSEGSYSITVTNVGTVGATGLVVTDLLPAGVTFVAMSDAGDPQPADSTSSVLVWTLGQLDVGQSVTLTFTVTLGDGVHSGDSLVNRASAESDQGCASSEGNSCADSATTEVTAPPGSLETEKSASIIDGDGRTTATAGDQIEFTVTVTNTSTLPIDLTVVKDPMLDDAGIALDCGPLPVTIEPATPHTCTSAPYTVTAADVAAGTVRNLATAQGTYSNGEDATTVPDTAEIPAAPPTLEVTKSGPATAIAGDDVEYTVTVANSGTLPANGVIVTDTLPAGVSYLDGSGQPAPTVDGQDLFWTVSRLAPGDQLTFTFTARIDPATEAGMVSNTASATSDGGCAPVAGCSDSVDTTVQTPGPLVLSKSATVPNPGSPVRAGDIVQYTITATNSGSAPLAEATLSDNLADVLDDAALTVEPTASLGTVTRSGTTIAWSGTLAAGQSATIAYSVRVTGEGNGTILNVVISAAGSSNCGPDSQVASCRTSTPVAGATPPPSETGGGAQGTGTEMLSHTGDDIAGMLALTLAILALGALLWWVARRRARQA